MMPQAGEASTATALRMNAQAELEQQLADDIGAFTHDPLGFVLYAFAWGEGALEKHPGPRTWQRTLLAELGEKLKAGATTGEVLQFAVASGHGIGKSALVAWLLLWAMSTCEDTRGVVTANTDTQLKGKTWAELGKWHRLAINGHWFKYEATSMFALEPGHEKNWRIDALPWSEHRSEAFAGLHNEGKRLIVIFDEASAIADKIWEVTEGALTDADTEILWFTFGNPTRSSGRFRECFRRYRHRWIYRNIDSRTVDGTNKTQIDKWVTDHGEESDFVKVRVRGQFPSSSFRQLIDEQDVERAFGKHLKASQYEFAPRIIGVDPAWSGEDETAIVLRQGLASRILKVIPRNDNDFEVAQLVARFEDELEADAVFVDGGYGTGIISAGRTMHRDWMIVWFSGKPSDEGCLNKRAEMWKSMRDWLKEGGALPPDDVLRADITGPETVPRVDGKLQLESKEDMKERGLPSPNRGDALALTFAFPVSKKAREWAAKGERPQHARTDYDPLAERNNDTGRASRDYDPFRER